jgi:hypothetical protein
MKELEEKFKAMQKFLLEEVGEEHVPDEFGGKLV